MQENAQHTPPSSGTRITWLPPIHLQVQRMVASIQHTHSFFPTDSKKKPKNPLHLFFSPVRFLPAGAWDFPALMVTARQDCCHTGCYPQPFQHFVTMLAHTRDCVAPVKIRQVRKDRESTQLLD